MSSGLPAGSARSVVLLHLAPRFVLASGSREAWIAAFHPGLPPITPYSSPRLSVPRVPAIAALKPIFNAVRRPNARPARALCPKSHRQDRPSSSQRSSSSTRLCPRLHSSAPRSSSFSTLTAEFPLNKLVAHTAFSFSIVALVVSDAADRTSPLAVNHGLRGLPVDRQCTWKPFPGWVPSVGVLQ